MIIIITFLFFANELIITKPFTLEYNARLPLINKKKEKKRKLKKKIEKEMKKKRPPYVAYKLSM